MDALLKARAQELSLIAQKTNDFIIVTQRNKPLKTAWYYVPSINETEIYVKAHTLKKLEHAANYAYVFFHCLDTRHLLCLPVETFIEVATDDDNGYRLEVNVSRDFFDDDDALDAMIARPWGQDAIDVSACMCVDFSIPEVVC